MNSTVHLLAKI